MKKLIIIGAGGFGREVADTVRRINLHKSTYELLGFVDDNEQILDHAINDLKVLGNIEWLKNFASKGKICGVMAIASADVKRKLSAYLDGSIEWENIIDPTAIVSPYSQIGRGNILQAFVLIGPNTKVGNHCMFNLRTNIGHDAQTEDFVSIMSMCDITGGVLIKEGAYLATSVSVVPNMVIGKYAFVCAGAVVLKDVDDRTKVIGYPAKRIL